MGLPTAPIGFGRSAWTAIRHGNQMNGIGLQGVFSSGPGANVTFSFPIFVAPALLAGGHWKVETAEVHIADPTVAGDLPIGDPAENWGIQIALGGGDPLDTAGGLTNNGQVIPINSSYELPIEGPESTDPQDVFVEPGDVVLLRGTKVGQGATAGNLDLTPYVFLVTVFLRQTPPGR